MCVRLGLAIDVMNFRRGVNSELSATDDTSVIEQAAHPNPLLFSGCAALH